MKIFTNNIDETTKKQLEEIQKSPISKNAHIRIMPDCHAGTGCVIGTTMYIKDKICPNVVGVDIGCGVLTVELGNIDIDLKELDNFIKENIPSGFEIDNLVNPLAKILVNQLYCKDNLRNKDRIYKSLGTLGGGNHFIEIDVDDNGNKYLLIHTGSRNLGSQVAKIYQNKADSGSKKKRQEIIQQLKKEGREKEISTILSNIDFKRKWTKDLDYIEGKDMQDYLHDMSVTQEFAKYNRRIIADSITRYLNIEYFISFDTVHNYIDTENMILRKGAVSAQKDEKLIIPINMRDGALICIGKGNEDWNYSAPHGAGRILSRSQARETLDVNDFKAEMKDIYTTTADLSTIDEAPMVYKPMDEILTNIKDTVDVIKVIKPIYNFKGSINDNEKQL